MIRAMFKNILPRLHPAHGLFLLIVAVGVSMPERMEEFVDGLNSWFSSGFGWLILLVCAYFVGLCVYLAFSRYGALRLGDQDEKPSFSTPAWLSMLFAAGMGSGLVFNGAAEPLVHFVEPPPDELMLDDAQALNARRAMAITYFHWGIHAWGIYAIAALGIAYYTFHRHQPMLPSTPISPMIPEKLRGTSHAIIDTLAILGVVFGLVSSLSQAVLQLSEGIHTHYTGFDQRTLMMLILITMFLCYMGSSLTDIGKGIKILSNINLVIALFFTIFVLFAGPTQFLLQTFVSGIGDYISQFTKLSFNTHHYADAKKWTESWTITYLLWWIAWGPFVGVFIARISRGRTIKEFLLGVILVPTVFSAFWFAVMGGTAIHLELMVQPGFGAVAADLHSTMFAMLQALPLTSLTTLTVLILLFVFLVTSADSGTYVLGMFTSQGDLTPSKRQRLFWGMMVGLVTAGAILTGRGTDFFRALAVVGSIPYVLIMVWQSAGLLKALRADWEYDAPEFRRSAENPGDSASS